MDLDDYDEWAAEEAAWFRNRLLHEGVEALRATCAALGEDGVREVLERRRTEIREYVGTTRNQRESIVRRLSGETERHAFLIAAAYTVQCGWALLVLAAQNGLSASHHPARSFLLLQASQTAMELNECFPSLWPFEDGPNPFD